MKKYKQLFTMIKYLRINLFHALLKPFSEYARKKRSRIFMQKIKPKPGMKILDIGGQPQIWNYIKIPLNITCLNLPNEANTEYKTHHSIKYVEGDGCSMPEFTADQFDLIFSNSVIEHVGSYEKRKMFANEVRRLSKNYWVQTPFKFYPIEAHCGMPFWWLYSNNLRFFFINRWRKKLPEWTKMVENTTVIETNEMKKLFPESFIIFEWVIFPKSLIVYSRKNNKNE